MKGTYKESRIELHETPSVAEPADVIVTFLTEEEKPKKRVLEGLQGLGKLPDDFDEPLDELKDYM